jgi:hypothetical protein
MILQKDDLSSWFDNLADTKPEYTTVKCLSTVCFYRLQGRKVIITRANYEPIPDLQYIVHSTQENRLYLRQFRDIPIDQLHFHKTDPDIFGYDTMINNLRSAVDNGRVYLLYTPEMIKDMKAFLQRLWNNNRNDSGTLPYKSYIEIATLTLQREDYADNMKSVTGYKTALKIFDEKIAAIWFNIKSS